MNLNIAIDGPAGAGKSTVARMVAQNLGYVYLDTGAMYRAITVAVLRTQTDINDEQALAILLKNCHVEIKRSSDGSNKVYLNGDDVTSDIRQQAVNNLVSIVSAQRCVRQVLVEKQKQIADKGGFVLDGRDIGTIVLPDAELKIYLVASLAVRAQRRYLELKEKESVSLEALTEMIAQRDSNDTNNAYGPMRAAADAITLDTDNLTIDQVATKITDLAKERIKGS